MPYLLAQRALPASCFAARVRTRLGIIQQELGDLLGDAQAAGLEALLQG